MELSDLWLREALDVNGLPAEVADRFASRNFLKLFEKCLPGAYIMLAIQPLETSSGLSGTDGLSSLDAPLVEDVGL